MEHALLLVLVLLLVAAGAAVVKLRARGDLGAAGPFALGALASFAALLFVNALTLYAMLNLPSRSDFPRYVSSLCGTVLAICFQYCVLRGSGLLGSPASNPRGNLAFAAAALAQAVVVAGPWGFYYDAATGSMEAGGLVLALDAATCAAVFAASAALARRPAPPAARGAGRRPRVARFLAAVGFLYGAAHCCSVALSCLGVESALEPIAATAAFAAVCAFIVAGPGRTGRADAAEKAETAGTDGGALGEAWLAGKGLTKREIEVALLAARGLGNKEIAAELGVSVRTVESHMAAILRKTDSAGRFALISALSNARGPDSV